jgi:hypothetical protein
MAAEAVSVLRARISVIPTTRLYEINAEPVNIGAPLELCPIARAVGATLVSPALQRGESETKISFGVP